MQKRLFTGEGHYHFVTFSCTGRRKLLVTPRARQIVISVLSKLARKGQVKVVGFVIMPEHVHAVLGFDQDEKLPVVMKTWKQLSAYYLRRLYEETRPDLLKYLRRDQEGKEIVSFWQKRYYDFNLYSEEMLLEKLSYMHTNPVLRGLAGRADAYKWSSAKWYGEGKSVGVRIDADLS